MSTILDWVLCAVCVCVTMIEVVRGRPLTGCGIELAPLVVHHEAPSPRDLRAFMRAVLATSETLRRSASCCSRQVHLLFWVPEVAETRNGWSGLTPEQIHEEAVMSAAKIREEDNHYYLFGIRLLFQLSHMKRVCLCGSSSACAIVHVETT